MLRSATDEIMYEIMRLSGQEYVDMYAARAKALEKESARKGSGRSSQTGTSAGVAPQADDPDLKAS